VLTGLLLLLLMPCPLSISLAHGQDGCPEGMVLDPVSDSCVKPADESTKEPEPSLPTEAPDPAPSKPTEPLLPTEAPAADPITTQPPPVVPTAASTAVVPRPTQAADIDPELEITKYACPAGFDARSADLATLEVTCPLSLDPIPFEGAQDRLQTTEEGHVTLPLHRHYATTVHEEIPPGYGPPRVFCSDSWDAAGTPSHYVEMAQGLFAPRMARFGTIVYAWQMTYGLGWSVTHVCRWFNIPAGQESTVQISKFTCPADMPRDVPDLDTYLQECGAVVEYDRLRDPPGRFDFTLTDATGAHSTTVDVDGYATWFGVPLGALTISEAIPDGYGEPVVYCRLESLEPKPPDAMPPYVAVPASSGRLDLTLTEAGGVYVCDWFNIPTVNTMTVSIVAWECPVRSPENGDYYDNNATWDFYRFFCATLSVGTRFTLVDAGGEHTLDTDSTGAVHWRGVAGNRIEIFGPVAAGYLTPTIRCYSISWDGAVSPGGRIRLDLTARASAVSHVVCHWYLRPDGTTGSGEVQPMAVRTTRVLMFPWIRAVTPAPRRRRWHHRAQRLCPAAPVDQDGDRPRPESGIRWKGSSAS
jgi:hypothetical protein